MKKFEFTLADERPSKSGWSYLGNGEGNNRHLQIEWFTKAFENIDNVLYINRKKAVPLVSLGVQFPLSETGDNSLFLDSNIKHEEDLVNARKMNDPPNLVVHICQ